MRQALFSIVFAAALLIGAAALLAEALLYSQNSFYRNDSWVVKKRTLEGGVIGADEFLINRNVLASNQADLGQWYGYQEIVSRRAFDPARVLFRFRLPPDSYLDVTYRRNESFRAGIRFSGHPAFPSVAFESDETGKFTRRSPIGLEPVSAGWQHAELRFGADQVEIVIAGKTSVLPPADSFEGRIGFRAGFNGAWIDDIVIESKSGERFVESFRNRDHQTGAFVSVLIALVLAGLVMARLSSVDKADRVRRIGLSTAAVSCIAILLGGIWLAIDVFFWSRLPLSPLSTPISFHQLKTNTTLEILERARFRVFETWNRALGGEAITREGVLARGYTNARFWFGPIHCGSAECALRSAELVPAPVEAAPSVLRVVVIGTSQTVGSGSRVLKETFFVRLHGMLKAEMAPRPVESFNVAVSGSGALELHQQYVSHWLPLKPDLVVINLGNNDSPEGLRSGIERFLKSNKDTGIRTVLLEEAHSIENRYLSLDEKHRILRELGSQYGVPVLPLHAYLAEPGVYEQGHLWWDYVHLTSFGQELVAQWLAPRLARELKPLR